MARSRAALWLIGLAVINAGPAATAPEAGGTSSKIRLAIIGDSDSHSYQDTVSFPQGDDRGGVYRATTLQWTEILSRLRGEQIDLGPWGSRGMRGAVAAPLRALGINARSPRKQDFLYNFSFSGARCEDLLAGRHAQARQLAAMMAAAPEAWRDAVVVIRIGINSIGRAPSLRLFAAHGLTEQTREQVQPCAQAIRDSIATLQQRQSKLRFVVVGIFDNSDWPPYFGAWPSPVEQSNIRSVLDAYDGALRQLASKQIAFFDDRAWFAGHWGSPAVKATSAYKTVSFGGRKGVMNSQGDHPTHAVLEDGHAGTAWNGLWAAELVRLLNETFGMSIAAIRRDEITRLADPDGSFGLR